MKIKTVSKYMIKLRKDIRVEYVNVKVILR